MSGESNKRLGKLGESIASYYLSKNKYRLLKRNWYCNHGELDIVATFNKSLVFVEVKLVTKNTSIYPTELYNFKKRHHLRRTIGIFLNKYKLNVDWRLDLVCITIDGRRAWVEHFVNVALA